MFNKPEPPKDDKPKGKRFTELSAWDMYEKAMGTKPPSRKELRDWIKSIHGSDAEVS